MHSDSTQTLSSRKSNGVEGGTFSFSLQISRKAKEIINDFLVIIFK